MHPLMKKSFYSLLLLYLFSSEQTLRKEMPRRRVKIVLAKEGATPSRVAEQKAVPENVPVCLLQTRTSPRKRLGTPKDKAKPEAPKRPSQAPATKKGLRAQKSGENQQARGKRKGAVKAKAGSPGSVSRAKPENSPQAPPECSTSPKVPSHSEEEGKERKKFAMWMMIIEAADKRAALIEADLLNSKGLIADLFSSENRDVDALKWEINKMKRMLIVLHLQIDTMKVVLEEMNETLALGMWDPEKLVLINNSRLVDMFIQWTFVCNEHIKSAQKSEFEVKRFVGDHNPLGF